MNDRFKFRVWGKERKRYTSVNPVFMRIDRHTREIVMPNGDGQYVIEQCTGLRDKNGKLIYEGDVLQYTDTNGFKIRQEVVWNNENARFAHIVDLGCFCRTFSPLDQELCSQKEIVGNIHEVEK
mgnify:CR=1 FL=1